MDRYRRDKDNLVYTRECYSSNKLSVYVFILGVLVGICSHALDTLETVNSISIFNFICFIYLKKLEISVSSVSFSKVQSVND